MALANPVPSGTLTQLWGHSFLKVEPSMWRNDARRCCFWNYFPGSTFDQNCHNGIDLAAPYWTTILAMEAGVVTRSEYDGINGGGHVVEVEIARNVRFAVNHCAERLVGFGWRVKRGQAIARVGSTGTIRLENGTFIRSSYGNHTHVSVTIREADRSGTWRDLLFDPKLFMAGGSRANEFGVTSLPSTSTQVPDEMAWIQMVRFETPKNATIVASPTSPTVVYKGPGKTYPQHARLIANTTRKRNGNVQLPNNAGLWVRFSEADGIGEFFAPGSRVR